MFKTISLFAIVIIVGILIFAATRPDEFRVERSINVKAKPEAIFPLIADLHNFGRWSPYEKMDPAMQRSFSGAPAGRGAAYEWNGNKNVGHGRMEITDAPAPSKVTMKLDFYEPFEAHNTAEFTLQPQGDGTRVTWSMFGPAPFMSKLMGVFFSMDKMVGDQFEEGLANLKTLAETAPAAPPAPPQAAPAPAPATQP